MYQLFNREEGVLLDSMVHYMSRVYSNMERCDTLDLLDLIEARAKLEYLGYISGRVLDLLRYFAQIARKEGHP